MAAEGLGLEITQLRLGLPGGAPIPASKNNDNKRVFLEVEVEDHKNPGQGRSKQAVGWPPVCSYRRRNSLNFIANNDDFGI